MKLPITTEPNEILHKVGEDIGPSVLASPDCKRLVDDMIETMYAADGVGLAAPQVGVSIQLCVIAKKFSARADGEELVLVNPVWEKMSRATAWDDEGCLSVPEIYGTVKRYTHIRVRALDRHGQPIEFEARDFPARVIQHEIDHLNGVLFIEKAKNLRKIEQ